MIPQRAKVIGKMTSDTFGCEADYFRKYIKGKSLKIVFSNSKSLIRVQDENQEEWTLFSGQYALVTGLAGSEDEQGPKAAKAKLSRK